MRRRRSCGGGVSCGGDSCGGDSPEAGPATSVAPLPAAAGNAAGGWLLPDGPPDGVSPGPVRRGVPAGPVPGSAGAAGTIRVASRGGGSGKIAARPGSVPDDSSPQARRSATANSGQVAYRSIGTLARALVITSSTAAGRSGRRVVSAGGIAEIWAHMTATDSSLTNGGWPVSMVYAEQASAYSSVRPSTARASICSGAM